MAQDLTRYTYWLAVLLTPGVGARLAAELLKHLGAPEKIFPLRARSWKLAACRLRSPAPFSRAARSKPPSKNWKKFANSAAGCCRGTSPTIRRC